MDKITRIHIAKVPYEIGSTAEKELQKYLHDIREQLDDDLVEETMADIEVRITEILLERGVKRNEVITSQDVQAVQEQLGTPGQFGGRDDEQKMSAASNSSDKRLLRDPDNSIIAGICSGLAAYFDIDPNIVRMVFVILIFFSGLGFVLYLVLWLLVPVAKSNSDKLLMRGQPVTAEALQKYRTSAKQTLSRIRLHRFYVMVAKICRVILTTGGLVGILILLILIGLSAAVLFSQPLRPIYTAYHINYLFVGFAWLLGASLIGLLIVMILRLWQLRSLLLKVACFTLLGFLIISLAGMSIAAPFIINHYRSIYGGNNLARPIQISSIGLNTAPTSLSISGSPELNVSYIVTDQPVHATYQAYPGMRRPDITIVNKSGAMSVTASNVGQIVPNCIINWCHGIYLPLKINIYGPQVSTIAVTDGSQLTINNFDQIMLSVQANLSSEVNLNNGYSQAISLTAMNNSTVYANGVTSKNATISVDASSSVSGPTSDTLNASLPTSCTSQILSLDQDPLTIVVNNQTVPANIFNQSSCVNVDSFAPGMPPSVPAVPVPSPVPVQS